MRRTLWVAGLVAGLAGVASAQAHGRGDGHEEPGQLQVRLGRVLASGLQALAAHREPSPLEELVDVLDWACEQQVIRALDRALLLMLVWIAYRLAMPILIERMSS